MTPVISRIQRSKQQALMFLLGAVLVGGALGFSAERVLTHDSHASWSRRQKMYEDLGLTPQQQASVDSLMDESNHRVDSILKPVKPAIDSIRATTRANLYALLTPEQRALFNERRAKFEARFKEDSAKRAGARRAREQTR